MKYCSTRGGFKGLTFEEAVFTGFKSDGGILLPESIPKIEPTTLKSWANLSYPDIVKKIVPLFISEEEIPRADVNGSILIYLSNHVLKSYIIMCPYQVVSSDTKNI